MGRLDELGDVRMRATLKDAVLDSSLNAVFSNVQAVGMGFVLIVASQAMRSGSFTVGDLSLFIFYLGHMNGFARDFGHLMTRYGQIGVSIDRLVKLMPGAGPGALIAPGPTYLTGDLPTVVQTERVAGDRLETSTPEVSHMNIPSPGGASEMST